MKKPKDTLMEPLGIDMTPMIDVVFQLIIFFMIAIDLSQADLAELQLPKSLHAVDDKQPESGRLYVNINRHGEYILKRDSLSLQDLETELRLRIDLPRPEGLPIRDAQGLAERPLLIRADRASEFKHVQKVMYVCGKDGLKIWKLELAAAQEKADDGAP